MSNDTYTDTHRFLLRLISSQSVLSLEDTINYVKNKAGSDNVNVKEMVKLVNEKIKPLQQTINIVKDEVTGEEMVVFLNIAFDETSKAQNIFSPLELEFFRVLLEQIMTTETREISEISALNAVNDIKVNNRRLSKMDAQKILNTWCALQFLEKVDRNYALGVRGIHEFETYLCTNMPDAIEKCYLCSNIVFRGYNCPNCAKAIHNRCFQVSLSKADKWPCCKTTYNHSQLQQLRGQRLDVSTMPSSSQTLGTTRSEDDHVQSTMPSSSQILGTTQSEDDHVQNLTDEMETEDIYLSSTSKGRKRKHWDRD